jgi:hypothetical protein
MDLHSEQMGEMLGPFCDIFISTLSGASPITSPASPSSPTALSMVKCRGHFRVRLCGTRLPNLRGRLERTKRSEQEGGYLNGTVDGCCVRLVLLGDAGSSCDVRVSTFILRRV